VIFDEILELKTASQRPDIKTCTSAGKRTQQVMVGRVADPRSLRVHDGARPNSCACDFKSLVLVALKGSTEVEGATGEERDRSFRRSSQRRSRG
jgi:hypothetical protein